jgi:6-phosphofructokinase 1
MTDLHNVAGKTKLMPENFINANGNNVTDAFKYYLQPLLGYMPEANMLRAPRAEKILNR